MRRRSRTRRVAKWVGTVLCLLIIALFAVSWGWFVGWFGSSVAFGIGDGVITVGWHTARIAVENGLVVERSRYPAVWVPSVLWNAGSGAVYMPLWVLFVAVGGPTTYLWHRDRPAKPGHCQNCGYDLTGNVSGRCPECGRLTGAKHG